MHLLTAHCSRRHVFWISFNTTINAGNPTYIEVYAGDASGIYHGEYIYVNNIYGYSPYSYKPTSSSGRKEATTAAHHRQFMKMMLNK